MRRGSISGLLYRNQRLHRRAMDNSTGHQPVADAVAGNDHAILRDGEGLFCICVPQNLCLRQDNLAG
ncbi:hypothetical protein RvVAR0630_43430 [Agrobacterium vitis]|nr:hypothetical protein RvVAR0630_43430 [Agrobacterium vitis]